MARVFIGLENINPRTFCWPKKKQNWITEYRKMLMEWRRYPCFAYAGYRLVPRVLILRPISDRARLLSAPKRRKWWTLTLLEASVVEWISSIAPAPTQWDGRSS